jgi:hypothetical protein
MCLVPPRKTTSPRVRPPLVVRTCVEDTSLQMSAAVRNVKLLGDTMHLVSYPFLFWAMRHERRIGMSFNSQVLFFLALLFRYHTVLTTTSETLESVQTLSGLRGDNLSIEALAHIYRKKHGTYTFLLRLVPLLCSAAAVFRISVSYAQREQRDTLNWKFLLVPCVLGAVLLHHQMNPPVTRQDPWAVLKTSSYFIETVAIVPQLYLDHALRHAQYAAPGYARDGDRDLPARHYESLAFEMSLLTRGFFRGAYVWSWLSKLYQSGKGLQGSYGDNIQQLAGVLQMIIYFDMFSSFIRRRTGVVLTALCGLLLFHVHL